MGKVIGLGYSSLDGFGNQDSYSCLCVAFDQARYQQGYSSFSYSDDNDLSYVQEKIEQGGLERPPLVVCDLGIKDQFANALLGQRQWKIDDVPHLFVVPDGMAASNLGENTLTVPENIINTPAFPEVLKYIYKQLDKPSPLDMADIQGKIDDVSTRAQPDRRYSCAIAAEYKQGRSAHDYCY